MYIPLDPCEAQTLAVHCSFNAESADWITLLGHYLMIAVLGYCCGMKWLNHTMDFVYVLYLHGATHRKLPDNCAGARGYQLHCLALIPKNEWSGLAWCVAWCGTVLGGRTQPMSIRMTGHKHCRAWTTATGGECYG